MAKRLARVVANLVRPIIRRSFAIRGNERQSDRAQRGQKLPLTMTSMTRAVDRVVARALSGRIALEKARVRHGMLLSKDKRLPPHTPDPFGTGHLACHDTSSLTATRLQVVLSVRPRSPAGTFCLSSDASDSFQHRLLPASRADCASLAEGRKTSLEKDKIDPAPSSFSRTILDRSPNSPQLTRAHSYCHRCDRKVVVDWTGD
jgi:hypothetical protein